MEKKPHKMPIIFQKLLKMSTSGHADQSDPMDLRENAQKAFKPSHKKYRQGSQRFKPLNTVCSQMFKPFKEPSDERYSHFDNRFGINSLFYRFNSENYDLKTVFAS